MSPTRSSVSRGKNVVEETEAYTPMALGVSRFRSDKALAKVRSLVADAFNEHGSTEVRAGSNEAQRRGGPLQPVFSHALMAGLIPPFSAFCLEILRHYHIHLLHLHPSSVTILSAFAKLFSA